MGADQQLMMHVRDVCGSWIDAAVRGAKSPSAFFAALVANESGGDPTVARFESHTFAQLARVLVGHVAAFGADQGHRATFGAIGAEDLEGYLENYGTPAGTPASHVVLALVNLATSWGPTQIMGYEALAGKYSIDELVNLETHFRHAVEMLTAFQKRFNLPSLNGTMPGPAAAYFRCWNTGRPDGTTFDPQYVPRGLTRMGIYLDLLS
jgi:hypothetical protein